MGIRIMKRVLSFFLIAAISALIVTAVFVGPIMVGAEAAEVAVKHEKKEERTPDKTNPEPNGLPSPIQAFLFPGHWAYGDEVYLINDNIAPVTFLLSGDKNLIKYPVQLEVEVPAGIKLYGMRPMAEKHIKVEGKDYLKYTLTLARSEKENLRLQKKISYGAYILLWAETKTIIDEGMLRWRFRCAGVSSTQKSAKIIVKPALAQGPRPEQFKVLFVWNLYNRVPRELWDKVYSLYRQAGINTYLIEGNNPRPGTWENYCRKKFRQDGGRLFLNVGPLYSRGVLRPGKNWPVKIIEQGVEAYEKADGGVTERMAGIVDGYYWDNEFWVRRDAEKRVSTDKATIAAFARKNGLDESKLTPELVMTKHKEAFISFYEWQLAETVRIWAKFVRQYKPDALIIMCQGEGAGVDDRFLDCQLYDDAGVIHSPMIYTSSVMGFHKGVEGLMERVSGPVWPFSTTGLLKEAGSYVQRSPRVTRLDMLTLASMGAEGFAHWPDLNRAMGGLYLWEMTRAAAEIGAVEEFFYQGKRIDSQVDVQGLPEVDTELNLKGKSVRIQYPDWKKHLISHSYQLGEKRLITISNTTADKTAYVRVSLKDLSGDEYRLYDTIGKTLFLPSSDRDTWDSKVLRKGIMIKVNPMDAVFLMVSQDEENDWVTKQKVSDIRREYLKVRKEAQKGNNAAVLKKDSLEITWDDVDDDGSLEMVLSSPRQKVWITSAGGRIWGWQVEGRKGDLVRRGEAFGGCMDQFWIPEIARSNPGATSPYETVNRTIENGKASVTLRKSVGGKNMPGLIISKTYSIRPEKSSVEVAIKITSESSEPVIRFSYWSHNSFDFGPDAKLVYPAQGEVFVEKKWGSYWAVRSDLSPEQTGITHAANLDPIVQGWLATYDRTKKDALIVNLDYDSLLQIYRWKGKGSSFDTLEWMYQQVELAPFQSWQTKFELEYKDNITWNE